jgi:hypothetical protein
MDFSKFKMTPRSEMKEHMYKCSLCGEEAWYALKLPEHMHKGHLMMGFRRRCRGTLEWQKERPMYPTEEG